MSELLQFRSDHGKVIVEVDDTEPGFALASRDGAVAQARATFEEALHGVYGAAQAALHVFNEGALTPEHVQIEFGVRLNAEAGAVIAKTAVEGHLKVKLLWLPDGSRSQLPESSIT